MRKIWTRLASVALIVVIMLTFSACALFTTDLDKKYSPDIMVAAAADGVTISRQELYYGYLEWGYQYASYYSSTEELLEYITSALLNNKILEAESLKQFGDLRDAEIALAEKQAYASLDATIRSYIYEALGIDDSEDTEDEDNTDDEVDEPYSPSILVSYERHKDEYGVTHEERVFTMDLSSYADEAGDGTLSTDDYEYYIPSIPGVASQKSAKQAISKVIRNLQSIESGFTKLQTPERDYLQPNNPYFQYLSNAERAVLNREIDRMVRSNQTSILVARIGTAYNLGFTALSVDDKIVAWDDYLARGGRNFDAWVDMINGNQLNGDAAQNPFVKVITTDNGSETQLPAYYGCGRTVATNIANNAIDYYIDKVSNAINNQKNFPDSDLEATLMSSGLTDVYYVPTNVANNLFTVSHILIGYSDEQKTKLAEIQKRAEEDKSYNAQNALNQLRAETASNGVLADNILLELQSALKRADSLQDKQKIFRSFINQYNTDPGMQNLDQLNSSSQPQFEYLMSGTADNNNMVEEFTNASIELFESGEKGSISGLVWSDYGAHIIMYTRDIADFIYTGAAGSENTAIELLQLHYADTLFATTTSYGNRTCFDTLVDAYFVRSYSNYRYFVLNDYKHNHEVTIYNSEFKKFF